MAGRSGPTLQWTALLATSSVAGAEWAGLLPFQWLHSAVALGLGLATIARLPGPFFGSPARRRLLHPCHVKEVAEALEAVARPSPGPVLERGAAGGTESYLVHMASTSLGVQLSAGLLEQESRAIHYYTLSSQNGLMTEETAKILAELIIQLNAPSGSTELMAGKEAYFIYW